MTDIPGWTKDLLEAQATQIGQQKVMLEWQDAQLQVITDILDRLTISQQEREQTGRIGTVVENHPIKAEDILEFKPTNTQDDCEYFFFIEHIKDFVAQYTEKRVRPSLVSCLKNARTKQ